MILPPHQGLWHSKEFLLLFCGDRKASTANESNNTVSQKGDHDDVRNMEKISQTSPPIVDLEIQDIE